MPRRFGLQVLLLLALLVSPLFSSAQEPAYGRPESHVGIGVKFSTMGAGIEAAIPITSNTNLRGGFNIFSYSRGLDRDGIHYAGDWTFRSVQATFDWFPFHGAFHLSPGVLVYNGNEFTAVANAPAGQTFTLEERPMPARRLILCTATARSNLTKQRPWCWPDGET